MKFILRTEDEWKFLIRSNKILIFLTNWLVLVSNKIRSKIETCNLNHRPNVELIIPDCPNPSNACNWIRFWSRAIFHQNLNMQNTKKSNFFVDNERHFLLKVSVTKSWLNFPHNLRPMFYHNTFLPWIDRLSFKWFERLTIRYTSKTFPRKFLFSFL